MWSAEQEIECFYKEEDIGKDDALLRASGTTGTKEIELCLNSFSPAQISFHWYSCILFYRLDASSSKLSQLIWPAARGRHNGVIRLGVWYIPY